MTKVVGRLLRPTVPPRCRRVRTRHASAATVAACALAIVLTGCDLGSADPADECRATEGRITSRLATVAATALDGIEHSAPVATSSCDTGYPGPVLRTLVSRWQSRGPAFAYFTDLGWTRDGASTVISPEGFVAHLNPRQVGRAGGTQLEVGFALHAP